MTTVRPESDLVQSIAPGIWTAAMPEHSMLGLKLGTRMTIVAVGDGALWVHSPIALTAELQRTLGSMGAIAHIVAPNLYHHSYVSAYQRAWPNAQLHAPAALRRKRPDLRIDATLGPETRNGEQPGGAWGALLQPVFIAGTLLQETVFVHTPSGTLISSDLTENFHAMPHAPTRWYLKAAGVWHRPGWSRFLRFLYRDRRAARRSIDELLTYDFSRIVVAHGDIIEGEPKQALRSTFEFL